MFSWIGNMRMRTKLTFIMLLVGIIPVLVSSILSLVGAQSAISDQIDSKQVVLDTSMTGYISDWQVNGNKMQKRWPPLPG